MSIEIRGVNKHFGAFHALRDGLNAVLHGT